MNSLDNSNLAPTVNQPPQGMNLTQIVGIPLSHGNGPFSFHLRLR